MPLLNQIRKAHVIRIYQNNDPTSDVWVDVLRIDNADLDFRTGGQDTNHVLKWADGWKGDNGPNTQRKTSKLTVTNPDDSTQSIDIDIIEKMKLTSSVNGQATNYAFKNGATNDLRKADVVTVHNTDVSSLDMSKPVDWDEYYPVLIAGQQDTSQSLQAEIPTHFKLLWAAVPTFDASMATEPPPSPPTVNGQLSDYVPKNEDVVNAIEQT
jgi:hypothetical protein